MPMPMIAVTAFSKSPPALPSKPGLRRRLCRRIGLVRRLLFTRGVARLRLRCRIGFVRLRLLFTTVATRRRLVLRRRFGRDAALRRLRTAMLCLLFPLIMTREAGFPLRLPRRRAGLRTVKIAGIELPSKLLQYWNKYRKDPQRKPKSYEAQL